MNVAKAFFFIGLGFLLVALIAYFLSKSGISLGKLPGDIKTNRIYFPIVTSIVLSIVLTIILNVILWLFRK